MLITGRTHALTNDRRNSDDLVRVVVLMRTYIIMSVICYPHRKMQLKTCPAALGVVPRIGGPLRDRRTRPRGPCCPVRPARPLVVPPPLPDPNVEARLATRRSSLS